MTLRPVEAWRTVDGPVHLDRVEIPSTPIAKLPESSGLDSKLFARETSSNVYPATMLVTFD